MNVPVFSLDDVDGQAKAAAELHFVRIVETLKSVRLSHAGMGEFEIHDTLCDVLVKYGVPHQREFTFGPRCRADIWTQGIAIEVKKQRPARATLVAQVQRYVDQPAMHGLIVVLERSIILPKQINGKPVFVLSLNSLWGIAL
jgi:hypothetical protein